MVEWNGIFRLFRFSGILGQPREVHTKFRKEIPENVCSIRSTTRNFRKFWSNGKRPCCSRNFFFLTVADVSEVQETLWNVWPQNALLFSNSYFQSKRKTSTIFQVPYSSASFIFSSPTLCLAKQEALICGANEVSSHLQTTRKIELTLIMNTEMINKNKKTCLGNIQNTNQPF